VDYSDTTEYPDVDYHYDSFERLSGITNTTGSIYYTYYDDDRIATIDGPWTDDRITYTYDDLGQVKTMAQQNGQVRTYFYDYDPENASTPGTGMPSWIW